MKEKFKVKGSREPLFSAGYALKLTAAFLILAFVQVLAVPNLYAQQSSKHKVSGKIISATDNSPMPGVSVQVKGSNEGTISNADGNYSIEAADNDVIVFSFIGFKNQEIAVAGQTTVDIKLEEDIAKLDEVVVVGYGVQKKKLVTGATVQVKNEDLIKNHVVRIESALQGITPGMSIVKRSNQPGSDYNITIRGLSSTSSGGPLVLIDGVPGSLSNLNSSDVESIDVLKDAASAAIYGSRGAQGVILVTTKKGKAGDLKISYDGYYGVSNAYRMIPVLNAKEYAIIMNEASANSGQSPFFSQQQINSFGEGTNWQKEAFQKNAPSVSHVIGFSGGNEKSTFSASLSYNKENGLIDIDNKSNYERYSFRFNSEHKYKNLLKIGENLTYTHRNSGGIGVGTIYDNTVRGLIQSCPLIRAYDTSYVQPNGVKDGFGRTPYLNPDQANPLADLRYHYNKKIKYDNLLGDIYGEVEFIKGLKYRTDFGVNLDMTTTQDYTPIFYVTQSDNNGLDVTEQDMERNFSYNFDNTLTFQRDFGKHNIMVMVGSNYQDTHFFKENAKKTGGLFNDFDHSVLTNFTGVANPSDITGTAGAGDVRYSYFGRASYNFDEKYLATATLRRDASSLFGPNNRVGYFPSVSAGWVISREKFMETTTWLDFLKVRASWGQNGKEPTSSYLYMATLALTDRYYTYGSGTTEARYTGVSPDKQANPDLKWEASEQTDFGVDARFLKNFNFTFDYYSKKSNGWLIQVPVPGTSGLSTPNTSWPWINGGDVTNKGVEFELGYTKSFGDLMIDIKTNLAYNKNLVTNVPNSEGIIHGSGSVLFNGSSEFYRIQNDRALGYFWGFRTDGLFQTQDDINNYKNNGKVVQPSAKPGDVKFVDVNGDGVIDDNDKVGIGDPNPHYIYGINLAASYKGFDFSMNLQGQFGNKIMENLRSTERYYNNYTTDILDRWTGPGTSNSIPRVTLGDEANQNWNRVSDLYVHDAGFLKVKSINIGYDLKKSLLKNLPIQQFRIFVAGTNLLVLTKYKGMDPEVGYGQFYSGPTLTDAYASGIDVGTYPMPRTYMVGVNIKF